MRTSLALCLAVSAISLSLAGCSTVDSRIHDNQSSFNAAPATVQAKIRAGQVDVGFTADQVKMALGKPDRVYTRTTAEGSSEVWAYADKGPSFSFGVGMGSYSGSSAVGTGIAVGTGGDRRDDKVRIVFVGGVVRAIESRGK